MYKNVALVLCIIKQKKESSHFLIHIKQAEVFLLSSSTFQASYIYY